MKLYPTLFLLVKVELNADLAMIYTLPGFVLLNLTCNLCGKRGHKEKNVPIEARMKNVAKLNMRDGVTG